MDGTLRLRHATKNFWKLRKKEGKKVSSSSKGRNDFPSTPTFCVCSFNLIHFNSCLLRWLKSNLESKFSFYLVCSIENSLFLHFFEPFVEDLEQKIPFVLEQSIWSFPSSTTRLFFSHFFMHFNGIIISNEYSWFLNSFAALEWAENEEKLMSLFYGRFKSDFKYGKSLSM
jgi:hypothetical protein